MGDGQRCRVPVSLGNTFLPDEGASWSTDNLSLPLIFLSTVRSPTPPCRVHSTRTRSQRGSAPSGPPASDTLSIPDAALPSSSGLAVAGKAPPEEEDEEFVADSEEEVVSSLRFCWDRETERRVVDWGPAGDRAQTRHGELEIEHPSTYLPHITLSYETHGWSFFLAGGNSFGHPSMIARPRTRCELGAGPLRQARTFTDDAHGVPLCRQRHSGCVGCVGCPSGS